MIFVSYWNTFNLKAHCSNWILKQGEHSFKEPHNPEGYKLEKLAKREQHNPEGYKLEKLA